MGKAEIVKHGTRLFSVYVLKDPSTFESRYVGVTCRKPSERLRDHINDARRGEKGYKANWIRNLLASGAEPLLEVIEATSSADWPARERYWIAEYRKVCPNLCNLTDGGEGSPGAVKSEETIEKLRRARVGKGLGRKLSPEHKAKIGAGNRGKKRSESVKAKIREMTVAQMSDVANREKISESLRGRKVPPDVLAKRVRAQTGLKRSDQTKARISRSQKGRIITPEARAKISSAIRALWAAGAANPYQNRAS